MRSSSASPATSRMTRASSSCALRRTETKICTRRRGGWSRRCCHAWRSAGRGLRKVAATLSGAVLRRRRPPEPLPRYQFPSAVLLLPKLQGAYAGGRLLAVELGFAQVDVARDGGIADHGYRQLRKSERLDDLLAGHHSIDELFLVLDPSVGMAVAHLCGRYLLQPRLVCFELHLAEDLDVLLDSRLIPRRRAGGAFEQKTGSTKSKCACNREITTRYVHGLLLYR